MLAPAHELSAQQGWPACAPQTWQMYDGLLKMQRVLGAEQTLLPQHG